MKTLDMLQNPSAKLTDVDPSVAQHYHDKLLEARREKAHVRPNTICLTAAVEAGRRKERFRSGLVVDYCGSGTSLFVSHILEIIMQTGPGYSYIQTLVRRFYCRLQLNVWYVHTDVEF